MKSNSRSIRFAICLEAGAEEDLQVGKVYRVLPDAKAAEVGCLRVLDESGEDYLYTAKRFVVLDLPEKAQGRLLKAVQSLHSPRLQAILKESRKQIREGEVLSHEEFWTEVEASRTSKQRGRKR
jgi:hypothetical protein